MSAESTWDMVRDTWTVGANAVRVVGPNGERWERVDEQRLPRVARFDDLRTGMTVAWETDGGRVSGGTIHGFGDQCVVTVDGNVWDGRTTAGPIVILADPPKPTGPVGVPRVDFERLKQRLELHDAQRLGDTSYTRSVILAARELVEKATDV